MAFHDAYARLTPFELAFPDAEVAHSLADEIAREAEALATDLGDFGAFGMLGSVNAVIRGWGDSGDSAGAILQCAALVFHAFHFERAGAPLWLVETRLARALVGGHAEDGARPAAPGPAAYVQLPRNLFWIHADPAGPAEAVDGFFWALSGAGLLRVLIAAGMREGRPGLSVVPLPEAPLAEAREWMAAAAREDGADFATTLPGGELDGLYSLTTAGEGLKLVARVFAWLDGHSGEATAGEPGPPGAAPRPSRMAFRRITLEEPGAANA
ncbi:MAG: hypothetical protein Q8N53_12420 [Longimicrobiales bacterium]|nr:hypothetical protein [Longimicrobiales bacterium]